MLKRRIYIIGAGSIANSHVQTINKLPIDEVEVHVSDNNLVVQKRMEIGSLIYLPIYHIQMQKSIIMAFVMSHIIIIKEMVLWTLQK